MIREAVEVASPALGQLLDKIDSGAPVSAKKLHRALLSMTKYVLRMATRSTPFGTLAGVTFAEVAATGEAKVGDDHRRVAGPDMAWLETVIQKCQRDRAVLANLRVVTNNLCLTRGNRLVNPYPPQEDPDGITREVSVRLTSALRDVLALARRPVRVADLVARLTDSYPAYENTRIYAMVDQLVNAGFLVTDLRPPLVGADPLAHIAARINDRRVTDFATAVAAYQNASPEDAVAAYRKANEVATGDGQAIRVDLRFDARIRIPQIVLAEAYEAVSALDRASPPLTEPAHLAEFRVRLMEKYGRNTLVPLLDALDTERGIGPPPIYRDPAAKTPSPPHDPRTPHLARWVQEATLDGSREIALTPQRLASWESPVPSGRPAREMAFHLMADSMPAVDAGRFRLMLVPSIASGIRGASLGRLLHLFDDAFTAGDEHAAQLDFVVTKPKLTNVAMQPRLLPRLIPIGTFHDPDASGIVSPANLALYANEDRLGLVGLSDGREIRPVTYSMLNPTLGTNDVGRLLRELGREEERCAYDWHWGRLSALPFLPRVTYGRTVLTAARWVPPEELADRTLSPADWDRKMTGWQRRFDLPDVLQLSFADNRVEVDLASGLHRRLVQAELARGLSCVFTESPHTTPEATGWLSGHASEIVLQVPREGEPRRQPAVPRTRASTACHRLGGPWLYVKIYAAASRHNSLLTGPVRQLVADLPDGVDRWFFIRYRDPDDHLRLRFHASDPRVRTAVEAAVFAMCGQLRDDDLASRVVVEEYAPEVARYGDGAALTAAERVFHADSELVLTQLTTRHDLPPTLVAALDVVYMMQALRGDAWRDALLSMFKREPETPDFRRFRSKLPAMADTQPPALARRGEALCAYAALVDTDDHPDAFGGLLHMHHNRAIGIDPHSESASYAAARNLAQSLVNRERARQ